MAGLHQFILFHMHNGAYYTSLADISRAQLSSRLLSTLLYSLLQLVSFIMLLLVLKRNLGYSSLQQLAFVLDVHTGVVQTKLNLIFVYIMQVSLAHLGKSSRIVCVFELKFKCVCYFCCCQALILASSFPG